MKTWCVMSTNPSSSWFFSQRDMYSCWISSCYYAFSQSAFSSKAVSNFPAVHLKPFPVPQPQRPHLISLGTSSAFKAFPCPSAVASKSVQSVDNFRIFPSQSHAFKNNPDSDNALLLKPLRVNSLTIQIRPYLFSRPTIQICTVRYLGLYWMRLLVP